LTAVISAVSDSRQKITPVIMTAVKRPV